MLYFPLLEKLRAIRSSAVPIALGRENRTISLHVWLQTFWIKFQSDGPKERGNFRERDRAEGGRQKSDADLFDSARNKKKAFVRNLHASSCAR